MGFNFRKSFKIAPGIRLNIGKKGISSISIGGKGARVSLGKKGARSTVGLPGTGLSYSTTHPYKKSNSRTQNNSQQPFYGNQFGGTETRTVSFLLFLGILVAPYLFSWFTLRQGYSSLARVISFAWMIGILISISQSSP